MDLQHLIANVTPEIYQRLVSAVETGKWPDGTPLTAQQKAHSLQLVMLWQHSHNTTAEHMTIGTDGEIVIKSKQQFKQELGIGDAAPPNTSSPHCCPEITTIKLQ